MGIRPTGDGMLEFGAGDAIQATDQVFLVEKLLGRGGIAAVYACRQPKMGNRRVVLKILEARHAFNAEVRQAFEREPQAMARIRHRAVVEIFDRGFTGDEYRRPFFIMEYVPGEPLRAVLKRLERLPELAAVGIAVDLADGLQYVHKAGVVHCDIKPENVFINVAAEGGAGVAKLMDFGGIVNLDEPRREALLYTPRYAAPEQSRGEPVSDRTDVFSFGVMLFEMVAGATPFPTKPSATEAAPSLAMRGRFDEDLVRLVDEMLRVDASARPTAAEVCSRLRKLHRALEDARGADVHTRQTVRLLTEVRPDDSQPLIRSTDYQVSTTPDPVGVDMLDEIRKSDADRADPHDSTKPAGPRSNDTDVAAPPSDALPPSAPDGRDAEATTTQPPSHPLPAPDHEGLEIVEVRDDSWVRARDEAKKLEDIAQRARSAAPRRLTLVIRKHPKVGAGTVTPALPATIGRGDDADVSLPLGTISERHARIVEDGGRYWLTDLGSSNGTYVGANQRRLKPGTRHELRHGSVFWLDELELRVQIRTDVRSDAGAAIDVPAARRRPKRDPFFIMFVTVAFLSAIAVVVILSVRASTATAPAAPPISPSTSSTPDAR